MDSKDKEILLKLLKIAENQQKIINKLAQDKSQNPDPIWYGKIPEGKEYLKYDPLYGGEVDPSVPRMPSEVKSPEVKTKPDAKPVSKLPSDVKAALDAKAPEFKSRLKLIITGSIVSAYYDRSTIKGGGTAIKQKLQDVLGDTYNVVDAIGIEFIKEDIAKHPEDYYF